MVHRRLRHPLRPAAAGALIALLAAGLLHGCDDCKGSPTESAAAKSSPWPLSSPLIDHVPTETRGVVFVRDLSELESAVGYTVAQFASGASGGLSSVGAAFESIAPAVYGVKPNEELMLFVRSEAVGLAIPVDDPKVFRRAMRRLAESRRRLRAPTDGKLGRFRLPGFASRVLQFAVRDGVLLARTAPANPPSGPSTPDDPREAFRSFFASEKPAPARPVWPKSSAVRQVLRETADRGDNARAIGVVAPGRWIRSIEASGRARMIKSRLAHQLGPTAFRIGFDAPRWELTVDIRNRAVSGEPTVVADMGEPSGDPPPLGGLVEQGVLGVLRLSVEPRAVYRVLESTLPAPRREQVDVFWRHVRQKLLVDGPDRILENLTGHAAVVVYGLDTDRLGNSGLEALRSLLELRATREAILLPIESRRRAERLLDKLTQVSKGRLTRQRDEHTVQYLWMENGLQWALLLGDDYVLFVDSATSLDKGTRYGRRGRPLRDSEIEKMRIGPLLEGRDRSGLYVDTSTLEALLRQHDYATAAAALRPIRSFVVTTRQLEDASRTNLRFHLERP